MSDLTFLFGLCIGIIIGKVISLLIRIIRIKKEIKKLRRTKIKKALNKCFKHKLVYKGFIQIFPNATYHVDGKDVLQLYEELGIENENIKKN